MVVIRDTDAETRTFLATFDAKGLPIRSLQVTIPGQVAALNQGLEAAQGEIVSFVDDDAAPHVDWLARIETHFLADKDVGGVGGRDWVYRGTQLEGGGCETSLVGKIQWFGRAIGNHHLGVGEAREVDFLKGTNMSFRRSAIAKLRFDERLRGSGAQVHNDMAFCLALRRAGWKPIYDPKVGVNHYRGERFDEDRRDRFNDVALSNTVHNETLVLLEYLSPIRRAIFLLWGILVGTRVAMGFLQWLRFLPHQRTLASQKWIACLRGRWYGWRTWQTSRLRKAKQFCAIETL